MFFNQEDNLKIRSWIKLLLSPFVTKEEMPNRNLYVIVIKLINQMVNGKIKYPFNNYATKNELQLLQPIDIKAELTKKFYKEINLQNILNFGYQMQKQFLLSHPQYYNTFQNRNSLIRYSNLSSISTITDNFDKSTNNGNDIYLMRKNNIIKSEQKEENEINDLSISNSEIELNDEEIGKFYSIIEYLEKRINEDDLIIEHQTNEINKLTNILDVITNQIN